MKLIKLTQGKFAVIDEEDVERVTQYNWHCQNIKGKYPYASTRMNGKHITLHRFLMGEPVGLFVDHINGDTLDNRRENLRICTKDENNRNTAWFRGTSIFKGVYWVKADKIWMARIMHNSKRYCLGRFDTAEKAAKAYDNKARELFGEFAKLNFN